MAARAEKILQLKVNLLGVRPPVWRRLLAPADFTLADLHDLIQVAMGWENAHLHEFQADDRRWGKADPDACFDDPDVQDEQQAMLAAVFRGTTKKIRYWYDFGDDWMHEITLEKRLAPESGAEYPRCTGGKRACPPEDCGGPWGYANLLEALADPDHPEHIELIEWAGKGFDPKAFSIDDVNARLAAAF